MDKNNMLHHMRVLKFENIDERPHKRVKESKQKQALTNITDVVKDLSAHANKENITIKVSESTKEPKAKFSESTKEPKATAGYKVHKIRYETKLPEIPKSVKSVNEHLNILEELLGRKKKIDPFYPEKNHKVIDKQPHKRVVPIYTSHIQELENNSSRHQKSRTVNYKPSSPTANNRNPELTNIEQKTSYGRINEEFYFNRKCELEAPKLVDTDSNKQKPVKHVKINSDKEDGSSAKKYAKPSKRKTPSLVLKPPPKRGLKKRRTFMKTLNLSRFKRKKLSDSSNSYSSLIKLVLRKNRRDSKTSRSSQRILRAPKDEVQVLYSRQTPPHSSSSSKKHRLPRTSDSDDIFGIRKSNISSKTTTFHVNPGLLSSLRSRCSRCSPWKCNDNFKVVKFPSHACNQNMIVQPCEPSKPKIRRRRPPKPVCKCEEENLTCCCKQLEQRVCQCHVKEKVTCQCSSGAQIICRCKSGDKVICDCKAGDKITCACKDGQKLICECTAPSTAKVKSVKPKHKYTWGKISKRKAKDKVVCTCKSDNETCQCSLKEGVICLCTKKQACKTCGKTTKRKVHDKVTCTCKLSQLSRRSSVICECQSGAKLKNMYRWLTDKRGSGDTTCCNRVDRCTSCMSLPPTLYDRSKSCLESFLTLVRYFLIGLVALAWTPCIIVMFLGYWVTYPLRPKCPTFQAECNRSLFGNLKAMVKEKLACYPQKTSRTKVGVNKVKKIKVKRSQTQYPDKSKQYVVAHTCTRGWVMKPVVACRQSRSRSRHQLPEPCGACGRPYPDSGHTCLKTLSFPKVCVKRSPPCRRSTCAIPSLRDSCVSLAKALSPRCIPDEWNPPPCYQQTCQQAQGIRVQMEKEKIAPKDKPPKALRPKRKRSLRRKKSSLSAPFKYAGKKKSKRLFKKRTCWNSCKMNFKSFKEFEKELWAPGITCGNLYVHTMRCKPCTGVLSACPQLYPCLLNIYRLYKALMHCFLYVCTACIWMPWLFCCYLCFQFLCRCMA